MEKQCYRSCHFRFLCCLKFWFYFRLIDFGMKELEHLFNLIDKRASGDLIDKDNNNNTTKSIIFLVSNAIFYIFLFLLLDSSVAWQTNYDKPTTTKTLDNNIIMMWLRHPPFSLKYDASPQCESICTCTCTCLHVRELTRMHISRLTSTTTPPSPILSIDNHMLHRPTTTTPTTDILSSVIRVCFIKYVIIRIVFRLFTFIVFAQLEMRAYWCVFFVRAICLFCCFNSNYTKYPILINPYWFMNCL